ncbi:MAG: hypothetical protein HKP62_06575 [Sulfurovum sp.]|nr:hypothetical protein [Sulfurovum sp.]NNJ45661.1 hypothetical protein [Sulfurovum sp.]
MISNDIMLVWAVALFFVLYITQSIRKCYATTLSLVALFIITFISTFLHISYGCLFILGFLNTILVWRIINYEGVDRWNKSETEDHECPVVEVLNNPKDRLSELEYLVHEDRRTLSVVYAIVKNGKMTVAFLVFSYLFAISDIRHHVIEWFGSIADFIINNHIG